MTKKSLLAALAALIIALAVSGCGSEDPQADSADSSPSAANTDQQQSESQGTESESPQAEESKPSEEPQSDPAEKKPAAITISDFEFDSPESVAPGQTIMVTNEDQVLHTVTAEDGSFDVAIDGGATVKFKAPDKAGDFPFFCQPHPYMKSTLVVQ